MLQRVTVPQATENVPLAARRRSRRAWTAFAIALLLVGGYGLWWMLWSTPIRAVGGYGVGVRDVRPGVPTTIALVPLCLDGARSAVIGAVTVDPAGLTVVGFAVRRLDPKNGFGGFPGALRDSGFGDSRTFTEQCAGGDRAEVAVELVRGVNGPALTRQFTLHWSAGLRSGELSVPVGAALCLHGQVNEFCSADPVPFDGKR